MGLGRRLGDAPDHRCKPAGAPVLSIGNVRSGQRNAATNADVWSSDGGSNTLYDDSAPICPQCWMAYLAPIGKWSRSLTAPDQFRVPLAAAIREFPVPRRKLSMSSVVYNQLYGDGSYTESVGYWYERDDSFTKTLRKYAEAHALALDFEPGPPGRQNEVLVSASCSRHV